jgi:hypothetical protein
MTKKVITPENLEVKELEAKIAPVAYSNVLISSLFNGVNQYVATGGNSWQWNYTQNTMQNYLGYNYNPMGIINNSYQPYSYSVNSNYLSNYLAQWLS